MRVGTVGISGLGVETLFTCPQNDPYPTSAELFGCTEANEDSANTATLPHTRLAVSRRSSFTIDTLRCIAPRTAGLAVEGHGVDKQRTTTKQVLYRQCRISVAGRQNEPWSACCRELGSNRAGLHFLEATTDEEQLGVGNLRKGVQRSEECLTEHIGRDVVDQRLSEIVPGG